MKEKIIPGNCPVLDQCNTSDSLPALKRAVAKSGDTHLRTLKNGYCFNEGKDCPIRSDIITQGPKSQFAKQTSRYF